MDSDLLWHSVGSGAIVTALIAGGLTLIRLWLEHDERRRTQQRDAEARLERILEDRLAEADRRFERCDELLHAALREETQPQTQSSGSRARQRLPR